MMREVTSNHFSASSFFQLSVVRHFFCGDLRRNKARRLRCQPHWLMFYVVFTLGIIACVSASAGYDAEKLRNLLVEKALPEGMQGRVVYVSKQPLPGGSEIESWRSKFVVPEQYQQAWFFFVDDAPNANWEHRCRYIYIDIESGEYQVEQSKTPPKDLSQMNQVFPKN